MNEEHWYLQERRPRDVLHKLVEIFANKGWLNKKLRMKYQNKRYWLSCSEERFFAYQINEKLWPRPRCAGLACLYNQKSLCL